MAGVAQRQTDAEAFYEKGQQLRAAGDIGGAISSFNQALKAKPDFIDACLDLARLLEATRQIPVAVKMYEYWFRILQINAKKNYVFHDVALGKAVEKLLQQAQLHYERGEVEAAKNFYASVLAKCPDMPTALLGLGACLHARQRYADAVEKLLEAIGISAGYAAAFNTLGSCYSALGQFSLAVAAYRQAIAADPKTEHVWANLVRTYGRMQEFDLAFAAYIQSLDYVTNDTEPLIDLIHLLSGRCQWDMITHYQDYLEQALHAGGYCEPFKSLVYSSLQLQRENAEKWAKKYWPTSIAYDSARPLPQALRENGKLRIGYLSSDFHTHATLALITEMFEQHDKNRFEIYGYSCGPDDQSPDRARAKKAMDVFRDVSALGDQEAADIIVNDGIDILVDLKGYTKNHRLGIAAQRPAPVQIHYLGYPGTIGGNFIDYYIADSVTVPPGSDEAFRESLIRLPQSYQINDRNRTLPAITKSRTDYGLPETGLVICDFNASYKFTRAVFAVWMRVLVAVPDSVLWLYSTQEDTIQNIRQEAAKYEIDSSRLVFAGHMPAAQHLERYRYADLCLDTTPYAGHTTASDALWCGLPVVALAGKSFCSRVAGSLLHAVGLPDLVANDLAEYEKIALELARNRDKIAQLKDYLEQGRMQFPLFDSVATTRAIEAAYIHAARLHANKKPPQSFTLTPELKIL